MSHTAPLIVSPLDLPTLRHRLDVLERRCSDLWADEPCGSADREAAFARLSDVEHRVVGLILKSLAEPDDRGLVPAAEQCGRELDDLGAMWAAPRAA